VDRLPPLNALRAFEAAARLSSFKLAGEELRVTAGAVSHQVVNLEQFLGTKLFQRHHRRVVPTSAGRSYLREVQKGLQRIAHATHVLTVSLDRSVLRLKAPPTFAARWLMPRLADFHARHPDISVQVTTSHDAVDFASDDVDAAIHYGTALPRGAAGERLFKEVLVPVCSRRYMHGAKELSPRELADKVLLHSLRRPDDWPRWFAAAGAPGLKLNQKLVFENSSLTYQGAINELGIAIAQIALVRDELISGQLVMPTGFTLTRDAGYFLSYPRERARLGKIRLLHTWLADEVRTLKRHVSSLQPAARSPAG
jgi:LysR family transcriptional regulator, glycine cleavage system transcriptional activator